MVVFVFMRMLSVFVFMFMSSVVVEGVSVEDGKRRWRLGDDYRRRTDSRLYINMSFPPTPPPSFICLSFVCFTKGNVTESLKMLTLPRLV